MITLVEALNYRCLRYVKQELGEFQILVGPNASGKTTFLDVIGFLGDLVSEGLTRAVENRTRNFHDLVWMREESRFELAVEARIPEEKRNLLSHREYDTLRYEVALGIEPKSKEIHILAETALLKKQRPAISETRSLFPALPIVPSTILTVKQIKAKDGKRILTKVPGGNDNYYSETYKEAGKGWMPSVRLGPRKSALGNLPEDETNFPVAAWFKNLLSSGVQRFILNSLAIRQASPPGQIRGFKSDGSNLPWVVSALSENKAKNLRQWVAHLRTALPDLMNINTIERKDDKHRYLVLEYKGGLRVPSWMASDGTLRLLALTLPAYLPDFSGVYLIEEPENGIHPRAVETVFQSLSSVYNAQILMASHSPVILSLVEVAKVLCFAKTEEGAADIVRGDQHPKLKNWHGTPNLAVLFGAGVLG
jgi:predicted ATPase